MGLAIMGSPPPTPTAVLDALLLGEQVPVTYHTLSARTQLPAPAARAALATYYAAHRGGSSSGGGGGGEALTPVIACLSSQGVDLAIPSPGWVANTPPDALAAALYALAPPGVADVELVVAADARSAFLNCCQTASLLL